MASLRNTLTSPNLFSKFSTAAHQSNHHPLTLSFPSSSSSSTSNFPSLNLTRRSRRGLVVAMSSPVGESYAVALLEVAKTTNTLETTSADMEKLETLFADPQLADYLSNPIINDDKKKSLIDEIANTLSLQPHVSNFLNIIVDGQRIDSMSEIVREFEVAYNRLTDTELALVSSVVTLESQHLAQIAKQVQKLTGAKNVRIKTKLDPSLVAGFTVRYGSSGSKLIDMSVKKQLEEIAAQLEVGDIQLAAV
ncbi:ATP synthase delta chain, chloroplastic [Linum grandiflorum]